MRLGAQELHLAFKLNSKTVLKIGFLNQPFDYAGPPDPGGSVGIWSWEVARRLAREHQVISAGPRGKLAPVRELCEGVTFHRFPLTLDHLFSRLRNTIGLATSMPEFASSAYYPVYAYRGARALASEQCEIVHIQQFSQYAPIVRSMRPNAKIVLHMHSDWLVQLDAETISRRLDDVDAVVGCSNYVVQNIRSRFPQHASKCATVYNGVDLEGITPSPAVTKGTESGKRIVFVGRVTPEKGLHVLIDAFERVLMLFPDAHLEIIGGEFVTPIEFTVARSDDPMVRDLRRFYDGSYLETLRSRSSHLEGHVHFFGHIPRDEMIARLRDADVFVQPSIASEMFGMAVADAMAAGRPVVATAICGLPEVVCDQQTGFLIAPNDSKALADALGRLLGDSALRARLGSAGRQRVERLFSWDRTASELERVYEGLASGDIEHARNERAPAAG